MIKLTAKGDFSKTNKFFERLLETVHLGELDKYGQIGVEALSAATPVDTGKTASSWYYTINREKGRTQIVWHNSNMTNETSVAILIQYGHANKDGTYVTGVDFINPALAPVFDSIADEIWEEVTKK